MSASMSEAATVVLGVSGDSRAATSIGQTAVVGGRADLDRVRAGVHLVVVRDVTEGQAGQGIDLGGGGEISAPTSTSTSGASGEP